MRTRYLKKASNDVLSHCACEEALITYPPQMECPWCGCGWLFTCTRCRKAFTFAVGIEIDRSLTDLASEDLLNKWGRPPQVGDVAEWKNTMEQLLGDVQVGQEYVYLDGRFYPAMFGPVRLRGWHAAHDLRMLPQVEARSNAAALQRELLSQEYWTRNALPQDESA